jgi:hypothetical protein
LVFYTFLLGFEKLNKEIYVGKYHSGLFTSPHTASYYLLFIFIYVLFIEKKINAYYYVSLIGIFLSGVRTTIIIAGIVVFLHLITEYNFNIKKNRKICLNTFFAFLIIILVMSVIKLPENVEVISRLSNLAKPDDLSSYGGGRIEIAKVILGDVRDRHIFNLLFGKPIQEVYKITNNYFGESLWAHNDLTMILFVLGIAGLLIYFFYLFILPVAYLYNKCFKSKICFHRGMIILLTIFLLAIFNGFYTYYGCWYLIYLIAFIPYSDDAKGGLDNRITA